MLQAASQCPAGGAADEHFDDSYDIKYDFFPDCFDTVGFSYDWEESLKTAIYPTFLQEVKGTLDAMAMFIDKFCK